MYFLDRRDAGRRLADSLLRLRHENVVVLGLPRGGVPVAAEVASALNAPLDVISVRKIGVPFQPEVAMGAVGEDGVHVVDDDVRRAAGVTDSEFAAVQARETVELNRRAERYRRGRARMDLRGRTAIVVDDGVATGSTARAACQVARAHGASRVVLAVPVAPSRWVARFADANHATEVADELVCVAAPDDFRAVGQFYRDFAATSDEEVVRCLDEAARRLQPDALPATVVRDVVIPVGSVRLEGTLTAPSDPIGIVVFAHGSGSSRLSPRNRYVARALNRAGLATLLFDLLTPNEEPDRANVFDVGLLADRLLQVSRWLREQPEARGLPLGYFGASTGAAAALWAAAGADFPVAAVVSRGGRPDLAAARLPEVTASTLLIVGGADDEVLRLNRRAQALLGGPCELAVVPDATHLFSEPGALERVARLAADWFAEHFATVRHG